MLEEQRIITQLEAAQVLMNPKTRSLFEVFLKEEHTLTTAARRLGISTSALHYHLKRFIDLNLVEVTRTESRTGRSSKYYRSTARVFLFPWHLTSTESLASFLTEFDKPTATRFYRELASTMQGMSPAWFCRMACLEGGGVGYSLHPAKDLDRQAQDADPFAHDVPPVLNFVHLFRFDYDTAKALQRDLLEVFGRYEDKSQSKGQAYACHLGLTPVQDASL